MAAPSTSYASTEPVQQLRQQVNEVSSLMRQNVNKVIERGERLEDLQERSDVLEASSNQFQQQASRVRRAMWWDNMKMKIILAVVILVLIAIIVVIILAAVGVFNTSSSSSEPAPTPTQSPPVVKRSARFPSLNF